MAALIFVVRTLLQVLLVTVFLLRVLLPLVRADSRNQLSQAVIRLTNPLVLPLRRILPPIRKIDTASIVALLIVQIAATAILWLLGAYPFVYSGLYFAQEVLRALFSTILQFYTFALLLSILLSWIAPGTYSPAAALLGVATATAAQAIPRLVRQRSSNKSIRASHNNFQELIK